MNFKSLALATTLAITGLVSAPGAEASSDRAQAQAIVDRHEGIALAAHGRQDWATMCRSEGTMVHMNNNFPGVMGPKFKAQTEKNVRTCQARGYSTETLDTIASTTVSSQDMAALMGMIMGSGGGSALGLVDTTNGYTRVEAQKFCLSKGASPRVEYDMYSNQATGYWECITNGTGYTAARIPMAR